MAFYSNKFRTLSGVKSPFISNDDIGISEILKAGDSKYAQLFGHDPNPPGDEIDEKEDDYEYFDDFQMDVGFRFRERPLISARLEKLEQAKKKRAKMKNIKWETNKDPLCQEDLNDLFRKKIIESIEPKILTSRLSELIQNHSYIPQNPYKEYAKYDGSFQYTVPTKTYKIYVTMLPPEQRNYPIEICCVSSAKIHELIGFILFKFSSQYGSSNLLPVSYYNLYITEDDGEVDSDLPSLDRREPSSKFGFTYLGLVQEEQPCEPDNYEQVQHTMSIEQQIEKSSSRNNPEKVKADEARRMESDIKEIEKNNKLMEAPLYRSYRALMITKIKLKYEVNIGISWQRIEIDPVLQKTPKFMPFKQKAVCYSMDSVVCSYVTERKDNKLQFRIVYCTNGSKISSSSPPRSYTGIFAVASSLPRSLKFWSHFKHCDFETDVVAAEEIVNKIESILELKSGNRNNDYKSSRKFMKRKHLMSAR